MISEKIYNLLVKSEKSESKKKMKNKKKVIRRVECKK
jgi:hypothetical protein